MRLIRSFCSLLSNKAALSGLGYTKYLAFEYIRNCPCADVPGAKVREQKKKRDEKKT